MLPEIVLTVAMFLLTASDDATQDEEIEGLGEDEDRSLGDYPIDTMLIRNETRTVHDIIRRIEKGSYIMDPDFQRDFIWPDDKQSKLIESVLMRIPLPVFYLAEDAEGRMIVVDGLQRLSTFQRFVANELKLKLPEQKELNRKTFSQLSPKLQNRIEDCNLVLYIIDSKVPERARLDIFERVNGGVPLTRQQMRNCLFTGQSTNFLKVQANSDMFLKATGKSLRRETMRDREFINRYCAFRLIGVQNYKGDMDEFLAEALQKMNSMSVDEIQDLERSFQLAVSNNYRVFEQHAFRKHSAGNTNRSVLNASLWDVFSTGLDSYDTRTIEANKDKILRGFYSLMRDDKFIKAVTYGTNDTQRVKERFQIAYDMLSEVIK